MTHDTLLPSKRQVYWKRNLFVDFGLINQRKRIAFFPNIRGRLIKEKGVSMANSTWQTIKVRYCQHAGMEVGMEAQVVYPAEWLPDQGPRVFAHRCSRAIACNMDGRASCIWAGTNPMYDPFTENE
jgi:hypothetical protein